MLLEQCWFQISSWNIFQINTAPGACLLYAPGAVLISNMVLEHIWLRIFFKPKSHKSKLKLGIIENKFFISSPKTHLHAYWACFVCYLKIFNTFFFFENDRIILMQIIWGTQIGIKIYWWAERFSVIDQNMFNFVLINNSRTIWPTKLIMQFSSFSDR